MSKDKKFHQTALGNIICAVVGIGLAVGIVLYFF